MASVARWLACPILFVSLQWALLLCPTTILSALPPLWYIAANASGLQDVLPPHPKTFAQAFLLGRHAEMYARLGCDDASHPGRQLRSRAATGLGHRTKTNDTQEDAGTGTCAAILVGAGKAVDAPPLSHAQLLSVHSLLEELDGHTSFVDRITGLLSFVNVLWFVSIAGLLCTVGPCIVFLCGEWIASLARFMYKQVLLPLHRIGALEVAAYVLVSLLTVQSRRYPAALTEAGAMVGLTGGGAFLPCWAYSTSLFAPASSENKSPFASLSSALLAMLLVPLALAHRSQLIGFLAVAAVYSALGFLFAAVGLGFLVGFADRFATQRCLCASVVIVMGFTLARVTGFDPSILRPFATGGMVLGNVMYCLALLVLSARPLCHRFGTSKQLDRDYVLWNVLMLVSLLAALAVGSVFYLPAMSNTASVFGVLWLAAKQAEVEWGAAGIVVVFLNCVALFFSAHYLHVHPSVLTSIVEPRGVYLLS